mmetsp:Transcript_19948/g.64946  ORF Transcript_19948/g.64946 Transcript_19948/m.64946 type:complete len:168 (-) Transcript_19948:2371-2874(-)
MSSRDRYGRPAPRPGGATAPICSRCLKRGKWTFECCKDDSKRAYVSRPSRSAQLRDPKLKPAFASPDDQPPPDPKREWEERVAQILSSKKKKPESSESDSSSSSSSDSDSSDSDSSSSSDSESGSSSSGGSGSGSSSGSSSSSSSGSKSGGSARKAKRRRKQSKSPS